MQATRRACRAVLLCPWSAELRVLAAEAAAASGDAVQHHNSAAAQSPIEDAKGLHTPHAAVLCSSVAAQDLSGLAGGYDAAARTGVGHSRMLSGSCALLLLLLLLS